MEDKINPSMTALKVTANNLPEKSEKELRREKLNEQMEADIKMKAIGFGIAEMAKSPMVKNMIDQLIPMLPGAVGMAKEKFGNDDIRFMIYLDVETQSFVFQKIYTANLEHLKWYEGKEPKQEDLFVISPADLEKPEDFIKKAQNEIGRMF